MLDHIIRAIYNMPLRRGSEMGFYSPDSIFYARSMGTEPRPVRSSIHFTVRGLSARFASHPTVSADSFLSAISTEPILRTEPEGNSVSSQP